MKKLLGIVLVCISCNIYAQTTLTEAKFLDVLPLKDGTVTYSGVVTVDSSSKDELFDKAKHWVIKTYKSGKDVIQIDNKETGEIIVKGFFASTWSSTGLNSSVINVWHTITIQVKESKYKYEISGFRLQDQYRDNTIEEWNPGMKKAKKNLCEKIDIKVLALIQSLFDAMNDNSQKDW